MILISIVQSFISCHSIDKIIKMEAHRDKNTNRQKTQKKVVRFLRYKK